MKETLIEFETAKLAKEKGFPVKGIIDWWSPLGDIISCDILVYHEIDMCCAAPTQSLLQKWLREEHSIDITVIPDIDSQHKVLMRKYSVTLWVYKMNLNVQPSILRRGGAILYFNRPENALEEGLIEALKLIK